MSSAILIGAPMSPVERANRLAGERSPYLLQHAHNPVDWYPWGEEAFSRAKQEDRPVFLSIGYSSCHWCHVMERECFEDQEVAELMNRTFVNVKVDREERPDVDDLYMKVCQMMTGGGGWPLSIIITPDRRPFYAATFIPKRGRGGSVGMMELVPTVASVWMERRGEVEQVSEKVLSSLRGRDSMRPFSSERTDLLEAAFQDLLSSYEDDYGGFEISPKFPTPHKLMMLMRYAVRRDDERARQMALWTLRKMSYGGIYDHVGHGFHRYSTDRRWLVPHFEKMLYDQALHAMAYSEAYLLSGEDRFKQVACDTLDYVLRDLRSPEGAFLSSEDADSEGEEGRFYTFTLAEVVGALGPDDPALLLEAYDIRAEGNYREEASGRYLGRNILHLVEDPEGLARRHDRPVPEIEAALSTGLRSLYRWRERRARPALDDKVLLDWNGLMVAALAKAYRAFDEPTYREAAVKAVDFIETRMSDPFVGLYHVHRSGRSAVPCLLNDLAFYAWGLTELFLATQEMRFLRRSRQLMADVISIFTSEAGDFYLGRADPDILVRGKDRYDGAVPSGNSVAVHVLALLHLITEDDGYRAAAERALRASLPKASQAPGAYTFLAMAEDVLRGTPPLVVVSDGGDPRLSGEMLRTLNSVYRPDMVLIHRRNALDGCKELPHLAQKETRPGQVTVHICQGGHCLAPITTMDDLSKWLEG